MPSDLTLKAMNAAHRALLTISGGRVGWHVSGMPALELTTTGRKSGQPRTVLLTAPLRLGNTLVVVASRGGDDRHPAWFLNLQAHPEVRVAFAGGETRPMRARVATAAERSEL
ncbi:MAG TPA: nitroreductase/quinone reductase family protein, partial [Kineosporiaceae bacterium]